MSIAHWKVSVKKNVQVIYLNTGSPNCPCVIYRVHNDGLMSVNVNGIVHLDPRDDCDVSGPKIDVSLIMVGTPLIVTAGPLWTDTGIDLTPNLTAAIFGAVGKWTWGTATLFDADGDSQPGKLYDEWIRNGKHGELIGVVLPPGRDPNTGPPRTIPQDDPRLFEIGTGTVKITQQTGRLWLGFNDDYQTNETVDNQGSQTVFVTTADEETTGTYELLGYCCGSSCCCDESSHKKPRPAPGILETHHPAATAGSRS